MEKNVSRLCDSCGNECQVYLKKHYLGIRFVEECDCGIRLCSDPLGIDWYRYAKEERMKKAK